ncbi:hypothetical protein ACLOJK_008069 [Asimina triloba]
MPELAYTNEVRRFSPASFPGFEVGRSTGNPQELATLWVWVVKNLPARWPFPHVQGVIEAGEDGPVSANNGMMRMSLILPLLHRFHFRPLVSSIEHLCEYRCCRLCYRCSYTAAKAEANKVKSTFSRPSSTSCGDPSLLTPLAAKVEDFILLDLYLIEVPLKMPHTTTRPDVAGPSGDGLHSFGDERLISALSRATSRSTPSTGMRELEPMERGTNMAEGSAPARERDLKMTEDVALAKERRMKMAEDVAEPATEDVLILKMSSPRMPMK